VGTPRRQWPADSQALARGLISFSFPAQRASEASCQGEEGSSCKHTQENSRALPRGRL
jgi:hypothetical protein